MSDCLFCKIINGEISSNKIYEDELCYAFFDITPAAPIHFLVISKEHIKNCDEVNEKNAHIIGHIFTVINKLTTELGITDGYRIINNCGEGAGQTVFHIHFHVLAGRQMDQLVVFED